MALLIAAGLTVMVAAYSLLIYYRNQLYYRLVNSAEAYSLSASALNYAFNAGSGAMLPYERRSSGGPPEPYPYPDGDLPIAPSGNTVTVSSGTDGGILRIKSTATVKGVTRKMAIDIEQVPGGGTFITKWKGEQL